MALQVSLWRMEGNLKNSRSTRLKLIKTLAVVTWEIWYSMEVGLRTFSEAVHGLILYFFRKIWHVGRQPTVS